MKYTLSQFPMARRAIEEHESVTVNVSDPHADPAEVAIMRRDGDKCLLILPMIHQGESIGLIEVLDHQRERKFSRQEMRLANAVAAQAAVALHNATVFAQLKRSDQEALTLRHAIDTIADGYEALHAEHDRAGVLQAAADVAARALGAISCVASCGSDSAGASGLSAGDQPLPQSGSAHVIVSSAPCGADLVTLTLTLAGEAGEGQAELLALVATMAAGAIRSRLTVTSGLFPRLGDSARRSAILAPCPPHAPSFVVVDTETTGLDPLTDHIIDIGAVRLDEDLAVVDRFTTLVDPGVPVPLFVTRLTGITDADLAGAPDSPGGSGAPARVRRRRPARRPQRGVRPGACWRRRRGAAARRRSTPPGSTRSRRPCCSSRSSTATGCRCSPRSSDWSVRRTAPCPTPRPRLTCSSAWRAARPASPTSSGTCSASIPGRPWPCSTPAGPPPTKPRRRWWPTSRRRVPASSRCCLSASDGWRDGARRRRECTSRLWPAGWPAFAGGPARSRTPRPPPTLRARRHRRVRGRHRHGQEPRLPAAGGVRRRGRRPPRTSSAPRPRRCSGSSPAPSCRSSPSRLPPGWRWALLMGRENYLCRRRLDEAVGARGRGLPDPDRALALAYLVGRARRGEVDLSALPYRATLVLPALPDLARELRSSRATCLGRHCPARRGCHWRLARSRAEAAHLVCVNHALLLTAERRCPPFEDVVIDEAHLLHDEATAAFSDRVDAAGVDQLLGRPARPAPPAPAAAAPAGRGAQAAARRSPGAGRGRGRLRARGRRGARAQPRRRRVGRRARRRGVPRRRGRRRRLRRRGAAGLTSTPPPSGSRPGCASSPSTTRSSSTPACSPSACGRLSTAAARRRGGAARGPPRARRPGRARRRRRRGVGLLGDVPDGGGAGHGGLGRAGERGAEPARRAALGAHPLAAHARRAASASSSGTACAAPCSPAPRSRSPARSPTSAT